MSYEKQIGCGAVLGVALLLPTCFAGCYGCSKVEVSDGYRDSTVRKVSQTGVFWKTWEVEALGDGMRAVNTDKGATLTPETFRYTVSDPDVLAHIQNLPPGKKVRVHYRKYLGAWAPNGETQFFITRVEDI
jgi:hypothetical protein